MIVEDILKERLSYYRLEGNYSAELAWINKHILKDLPEILDGFYQFLTSHDFSKHLFKKEVVIHLKEQQTLHWNKAFSGKWDGSFIESAIKVGQIHEKLGITPFLYIGGYNIIIEKIFQIVFKQKDQLKFDIDVIIHLLQSIIHMDMELALSSYLNEANLHEAEKGIDGFAEHQMNRTVGISLSISETAAENAKVLYDVKKMKDEINRLASSIEEVSASIESVSQSSTEVSSINKELTQEISSTGEEVRHSSEAINEIVETIKNVSDKVSTFSKVSSQIGESINVIEKIAGQIKVLAINATIEAARAGAAGKGFAVVAREVNKLSMDTSKSITDISESISMINKEIPEIISTMTRIRREALKGQEVLQHTNENVAVVVEKSKITYNNANEISEQMAEQSLVITEISDASHSLSDISENTYKSVQSNMEQIMIVENLIKLKLDQLFERDVPNKHIKMAKSDHFLWMKNLVEILSGFDNMNRKELTNHLECRFGQWYYSDETQKKYKQLTEFREIEKTHIAVHENGIKAVELYEKQELEEALEYYEKAKEASVDIVELLDKLEVVIL